MLLFVKQVYKNTYKISQQNKHPIEYKMPIKYLTISTTASNQIKVHLNYLLRLVSFYFTPNLLEKSCSQQKQINKTLATNNFCSRMNYDHIIVVLLLKFL